MVDICNWQLSIIIQRNIVLYVPLVMSNVKHVVVVVIRELVYYVSEPTHCVFIVRDNIKQYITWSWDNIGFTQNGSESLFDNSTHYEAFHGKRDTSNCSSDAYISNKSRTLLIGHLYFYQSSRCLNLIKGLS